MRKVLLTRTEGEYLVELLEQQHIGQAQLIADSIRQIVGMSPHVSNGSDDAGRTMQEQEAQRESEFYEVITAFMVFKPAPFLDLPEQSQEKWKLYFTTASDTVSEDDIMDQVSRYGWRVVKVTLDDNLLGHCEAL